MLGCILTFDARVSVELKHRSDRAWAGYHKFKGLLRCNGASWQSRSRVLDATAARGLLWGSSCWNLRKSECKKLDTLQNTMQRRMLQQPKLPEENVGSYMERVQRRIKCSNGKASVDSWQWKCHKSVCAWAGHVAGFRHYDVNRLTYKIMFFKSCNWIQEF